ARPACRRTAAPAQSSLPWRHPRAKARVGFVEEREVRPAVERARLDGAQRAPPFFGRARPGKAREARSPGLGRILQGLVRDESFDDARLGRNGIGDEAGKTGGLRLDENQRE